MDVLVPILISWQLGEDIRLLFGPFLTVEFMSL